MSTDTTLVPDALHLRFFRIIRIVRTGGRVADKV